MDSYTFGSKDGVIFFFVEKNSVSSVNVGLLQQIHAGKGTGYNTVLFAF